MAENGEEVFRLLLLGKTGSGKSTTGNVIAGQKLFRAAASFCSVTSECERKVISRDGLKLEIMDCPGLFDTNKKEEETALLIIQAVGGMHPGPHAILHVTPVGRYTDEEFKAYQRMKALFDEDITKHMIVLFTRGDDLEADGESVDDMIREAPKNLQQVLSECHNRYTVFNNRALDKRPQVEGLFSKIREMLAQNDGQCYSCPRWSVIGEAMEDEVSRRLQEVEKEELKGKNYVQQLERQAKEAEARLEEMEKMKKEVAENPGTLRSIWKTVLGILAGILSLFLGLFL